MVAIKRRDVEQWGLPGGMVDENEQVSAAVRREFTEEAGNISDPEERAQFTAMCDALFAKAAEVARGDEADAPPRDLSLGHGVGAQHGQVGGLRRAMGPSNR